MTRGKPRFESPCFWEATTRKPRKNRQQRRRRELRGEGGEGGGVAYIIRGSEVTREKKKKRGRPKRRAACSHALRDKQQSGAGWPPNFLFVLVCTSMPSAKCTTEGFYRITDTELCGFEGLTDRQHSVFSFSLSLSFSPPPSLLTALQDGESHEQSTDVRSQLKFFEQLEKMEKQRKEEQEREVLLKAAKVRLSADPRQLHTHRYDPHLCLRFCI